MRLQVFFKDERGILYILIGFTLLKKIETKNTKRNDMSLEQIMKLIYSERQLNTLIKSAQFHQLQFPTMINFFKRIGTVKHKFKVQFIIDKITMDLPLTQQLSIVVKRGQHKQETKHATLKKGVGNFKKEILVFDPVTMFYEPDSKVYTEKEGQIRLIIHTESGDKKLGGVIKFDLASYVNDKFEYKKEQVQFEKCPEKAKNSTLIYEVYVKFLRESNSQTGSELGALTKDGKKQKSKKLNQTEQPKPSKKPELSQIKDSVLDVEMPPKKKSKEDKKPKNEQNNEKPKKDDPQSKISKKKQKSDKPVVYFDKDRSSDGEDEEPEVKKDSLKGSKKQQPKKSNKSQVNTLKVIGHKKIEGAPKSDSDNGPSNDQERSDDEEQAKKKPEKKQKPTIGLAPKTLEINDLLDGPPAKKQPTKEKRPESPPLVKKNSLKPQIGVSLKAAQKRPQSPPPMITISQVMDNINDDKKQPIKNSMLQIPTSMTVLRPTQRTQKATQQFYEQQIAKLQKQNNQLSTQKQSLSLKVAKLTQTLSLKEKQIRQVKEQLRNDSSMDRSVTSGGNKLKELESKLAEAEKQRGMELLDHQSIKGQLEDMKAVADEERRRMESEMGALEQEYKLSLKGMKEELAEAKQKLEKSEKDRKEFERDRVSYKKEIEAKTTELKQNSVQLKEALDELTRKKLQVSQAMNAASQEQDQKLIEFLENHFF